MCKNDCIQACCQPTRVTGSDRVHNYVTKTGDSHMLSRFICFAGIKCRTSASFFFSFLYCWFFFPADNFSLHSFAAAETCVFEDNFHAWDSTDAVATAVSVLVQIETHLLSRWAYTAPDDKHTNLLSQSIHCMPPFSSAVLWYVMFITVSSNSVH